MTETEQPITVEAATKLIEEARAFAEEQGTSRPGRLAGHRYVDFPNIQPSPSLGATMLDIDLTSGGQTGQVVTLADQARREYANVTVDVHGEPTSYHVMPNPDGGSPVVSSGAVAGRLTETMITRLAQQARG